MLVSYGIFESDWVKMDAKFLKEVSLLQMVTSKRLVFRAGPFNEMSLTTFVAVSVSNYVGYLLLTICWDCFIRFILQILRASYSFYTLLDRTK